MPPSLEPDLCVIGGGTAGYAVALGAAALGLRCTLIDPAPRLGASQAVDLAEAMVLAAARAAPGPSASAIPALRHRIGRAVATQAPNFAAARLRSAGVTVLQGTAVFRDPRAIAVGDQVIAARRFVVATGARPLAPAWVEPFPLVIDPGALLAGAVPWPTAITILAGRPAGIEWAQALARMGAEVTLAMTSTAADPFDAELMSHVMAGLRQDGVILRRDADLSPPPHHGIDTPIMVFGPLAPATAALRLDRAGVERSGGALVADGGLRTANRRVYAIGDVLGRPDLGGAAIPAQVGLLLRALVFRLPARDRLATRPLVLRTVPALAQVGDLSPPPALRHGRVVRWGLGDTTAGLACGETGLVKIVASATGAVRGAGIAAAAAPDAIGPWTLAVAGRLTLSAMAAMPAPAGATAEAGRRAALTAVTARLRAPWVRRVTGWLRRLP